MDRTQTRRWWRAAWYIYARLTKKHEAISLTLPQKEWNDCQTGLERLAHLKATCQSKSLQWLEPDLSRQLRFLMAQLNALAVEVSRICLPHRLATTTEIFQDLAGLETEFAAVELDLKNKLFSVTTEPLELADQYLGPFQIELNLKSFGGTERAYRVLPLDCEDDEYPHPHVSGDSLCEGEGTDAIASALTQGRVFDFFVTVRQVLRNYDPDSAYDRFNDAQRTTCVDCGYRAESGGFYWCSLCDSEVCDECCRHCESCDSARCHGCFMSCPTCDETTCTACQRKCTACDKPYCKGCLTDGECQNCRAEETPENTTENLPSPAGAEPAVHALCVGQAAVPA